MDSSILLKVDYFSNFQWFIFDTDSDEFTPVYRRDRIIAPQESIDTAMTPTVEIEQPLLEAPEVSDLARQTKLDFALEGMVLTLLAEEDDDQVYSYKGMTVSQEGSKIWVKFSISGPRI